MMDGGAGLIAALLAGLVGLLGFLARQSGKRSAEAKQKDKANDQLKDIADAKDNRAVDARDQLDRLRDRLNRK